MVWNANWLDKDWTFGVQLFWVVDTMLSKFDLSCSELWWHIFVCVNKTVHKLQISRALVLNKKIGPLKLRTNLKKPFKKKF